MPNFKVTYTRQFVYELECDNLEHAGARAKNFAIGMTKNMGTPVKIVSVYPEGAPESAPVSTPTAYEKMVDGMRESLDKLLE